MNHAGTMCLLQSLANFDSHFQHLVHRQRALAQAIAERFAFQVFHDQIASRILSAHVVEMTDVRVAERGDGTGFAIEALSGFDVAGKMFWQNLDGYNSVQPGIARPVHFSHTARAERRDNFIRTEFGPRREPHALRAIIALWKASHT